MRDETSSVRAISHAALVLRCAAASLELLPLWNGSINTCCYMLVGMKRGEASTMAARDHIHAHRPCAAKCQPAENVEAPVRYWPRQPQRSRQRTETSCGPSISEQVTGGTHSHRSLATNTPNDRERRLLSAHAALVQCDFTIELA